MDLRGAGREGRETGFGVVAEGVDERLRRRDGGGGGRAAP